MKEKTNTAPSGDNFDPFFQITDGMVQEYPLPFADITGKVKIVISGGMCIVDSVCNTSQSSAPWQHFNAKPFVEMNFVLEGNMYQTHEGVLNRCLYEKGHHNILFNPYSFEKNELIGTGNYRMLGVHVLPEKMTALFSNYIPELNYVAEKIAAGIPFVLQTPNGLTSKMKYIFDTIWNCPEPLGLKKLYFESQLLTLLTLQCEALLHVESLVQKPLKLFADDKDKLQYARNILLSRLSEPPSIAELSKLCGLNEFKLKKGFRQLFGNSIFNFINEQRLQEAQRMIYKGEKNISAIAYELGYAHPQHFQRAFKKHFSVTPGSLLK